MHYFFFHLYDILLNLLVVVFPVPFDEVAGRLSPYHILVDIFGNVAAGRPSGLGAIGWRV